MSWAPWHKAVQLISQVWLCPLLQLEKLLEKQVSGIGVHCFVLLDVLKHLHCVTSSLILCKKKKKIFISNALYIFDTLFFSDALFLFFFLSDVLFSRSLKLDVTADINIMMARMTADIY